jgi:Uma2 family endonuclease
MAVASVLDISNAVQREIFQRLDNGDFMSRRVRYERVGDFIYIFPFPSRRHQDASSGLGSQIYVYLKGKKCKVYPQNTGLEWTSFVGKLKTVRALDGFFMDREEEEKDSLILDPDLMVVCGDKDADWGAEGYRGVPRLIVEVLSKGTAKNDLGWKKDIYEALGVEEYWIIDIIKRFEAARYNLESGKYVSAIFPFVEKPYAASSLIFEDLILDFTDVDLPEFDNTGRLF